MFHHRSGVTPQVNRGQLKVMRHPAATADRQVGEIRVTLMVQNYKTSMIDGIRKKVPQTAMVKLAGETLKRVLDILKLHIYAQNFLNFVSRPNLGPKSFLKMPGLEPGTSRLSMLSECAHHLRYIPVDPSAHTHSISGPDLVGLPGLLRFP